MTTPTLNGTFKRSDGKSVDVDLTASVVKGQVTYANSWLGLAGGAGDSGESVALLVDPQEYNFYVPHSLAVLKGDIVRINTASVTGHTPQSGAYTKNAASTTVLSLFKATRDAVATSDGNIDIVSGILIVTGGIV